jgi:hypothetical protein
MFFGKATHEDRKLIKLSNSGSRTGDEPAGAALGLRSGFTE